MTNLVNSGASITLGNPTVFLFKSNQEFKRPCVFIRLEDVLFPQSRPARQSSNTCP
jgi:hypothetical protein